MHTQKKLFTPVQIGPITLKHRAVMPPMSRLRAQWPSGIPSDLQLEYYSQRASDGGLILTEPTAISTSGQGYRGAPALYSDEQVLGWKRITDAVPLFRYVAERLNEFGLAYLHVIEPRIKGGELIAEAQEPVAAQELSKIFQGPLIAAGGFEANTAEATVSKGDADLIAFGRHFIANPDLPKRIKLGLPFNRYDRSTFYGFEAHGYTDYPAYEGRETDEM